MSKRCRSDFVEDLPVQKRLRSAGLDNTDRLSSLSDELLLHILSFLPIPSLIICQSLSRRLHTLAGDSEIWKRLYYSRWVLPRARRLGTTKSTRFLRSKIEYSPNVSTWLDHGHLTEDGVVTNWKRQYRLRQNWAKGACRVTEVELVQSPAVPLKLVNLCAGVVFTVEHNNLLKAWVAKDPKCCLASIAIADQAQSVVATALASNYCPQGRRIEVFVSFQDGSLNIYDYDIGSSRLGLRSSYTEVADGHITAIASFPSYLLMASRHKRLSLYEIPTAVEIKSEHPSFKLPRLVTSLRADSIVTPMALSIRAAGSGIISSIVYSFFHIGCGWSLGIQELSITPTGEPVKSRLVTTVDSQYGTGRSSLHPNALRSHDSPRNRRLRPPSHPAIMHHDPPTSISYSHPYLLTSHADNTLTMYLVVSNSNELYIKSSKRLFGHTSSVSAVQVSDRGKAVSVSSQGDEIRIWELETVASTLNTKKSLEAENSIQVSPENKQSIKTRSLDSAAHTTLHDSSEPGEPLDGTFVKPNTQDYIGFDDELVLLLRERGIDGRKLECYDFT
ncbi:hypothetical protein ASPZODRAFT_122598 [Penicilliopsis zonata CBS 506.65]|uniref:Probable E3 ubiquitin ligase complex SCF subunit sconB n=1 Tax=Penicilliopsis zonata CBS 506.65 TaxID=1073090 RepID=A0A1L9SAK4_9EURO|nr:hypothetical protein ASPZODRAFT_122598 [Penicilliopsis zonata CBS 506.65]OJJ44194.1 hypothetical protein ASPZODRAFT_122598 [Penicilliopsis zonata CBS 506.65]